MNFFTPVEVTPGTTGSWQTVDLSSYITSGASGVLLKVYGTLDSAVGWRKYGSTDNRTNTMGPSGGYFVAPIGCDASRRIEFYRGATNIRVWVIGEFGAEAEFFTNATAKPLTNSNVWEDIDISSDTGANTAIAAFFEFVGTTNTGLRKNGSTDARDNIPAGHCGMIIGLDASEICEGYHFNKSFGQFYLVGYLKQGGTFNTNATDVSLGSTGSYINLSALPSGALAGLYEVVGSGSFNLREDGDTNDNNEGSGHDFFVSKASASQIVEGKISSTSVDFYLIGYFTAVTGVSPSSSQSPSSSASPSSSESPSISPSSSASGSPSSSVSPSPSLSPSASASPSPPASNYGLIIKKQSVNKDVQDITDPKELVFSSELGVLGLHSFDTVTGITDSNGNINTTKNHSVGYTPITIVTTTAYDGNRVVLPAEWHSYYQNGLHELIEVTERFNFKIDGTKIRIIVHAEEYNHDLLSGSDLASRNYSFEVLYHFNELVETY